MNVFRDVDELHLEVTPRCNLRCRYCFLGDLPRDGEAHGFMARETACLALDRVAAGTERERVNVVYHGGEPMLQEASWFDAVSRHAKGLAASGGPEVTLSMQSNGSLATGSHLEVFEKHGIMVGTSLDGLEEQHNAVRGEFQRTLRTTLALKERGLLGGLIAVLTPANCGHVREYMDFLVANGFRSVSFNAVHANGQGRRAFTLPGGALFSAWRDILAHMLESRGLGVCDVSTLARVRRFSEPPTRDDFRKVLSCSHPYCHAGIQMLHVSCRGDIYPCGTSAWVDPPLFRLGHIEGEADGPAWRATLAGLHEKGSFYDTVCRRCAASAICSFGCSAFEKKDPGGKESLCEATKLYHDHLGGLDRDALAEVLGNSSDLEMSI